MTQAIATPASLYLAYRAALETVSEDRRKDVENLHAKAMGYVWGWQDAGGADRDSIDASDFAYVYGIHVAEFESDKTHSMMPIQDAFSSWRKLRRIDRDWYLV